MKESKLQEKFRQWRREVEGTWVLNMTEKDAAMRWAEIIGVPVEPDEPELPDEIHWYFDGSSTVYVGPSRESVLGLGEAAAAEIVVVPRRGPLKAYLDAAFAAYNARPRWRTGDPPEPGRSGPGRYLVIRSGPPGLDLSTPPTCEISTWHGRDDGWTWAPELGNVLRWQPLPE